LIEEITEASREQTQGVNGINIAITEIEKVVETNVTGTETLSTQAVELNNLVNILLEIVEGNQRGNSSAVTQVNYSPLKF